MCLGSNATHEQRPEESVGYVQRLRGDGGGTQRQEVDQAKETRGIFAENSRCSNEASFGLQGFLSFL